MPAATTDAEFMRRAIELARRGEGAVEPNPLVGCLIVRESEVVGEGWHARFGGPHAEVEALRMAGERARDATLYVTLEPCCHQGKTPPCSTAIIAAGLRRVVVAQQDPFPEVAGRGIAQLREAGIAVEVDCQRAAAQMLNAPYLKRLRTGQPWVIAKWAMTLDGKLATRSGDSRWISNERSRAVVHALRGRVDGIVVGSGTVAADDPLLTARPPGPRTACRIVLDSRARLPLDSQLVRTAAEAPVLVVVGPAADAGKCQQLRAHGCEVWVCPQPPGPQSWPALLEELGNRSMTNLLIEGGGQVLGSAWDGGVLDEVQVFVAPQLVGGTQAPSPFGGSGRATMEAAARLHHVHIEMLDDDVFVRGFVSY